MSKVKPITPKEVTEKKLASIPDEVIEAFNELIVQNWDGHRASILQDEVCKLAAKKLKCTTDIIYDNSWLDVENIFRKSGWKVAYDKPGYNESYAASFSFTKK